VTSTISRRPDLAEVVQPRGERQRHQHKRGVWFEDLKALEGCWEDDLRRKARRLDRGGRPMLAYENRQDNRRAQRTALNRCADRWPEESVRAFDIRHPRPECRGVFQSGEHLHQMAERHPHAERSEHERDKMPDLHEQGLSFLLS
jgi:protein tyrosine phosphatase (PTP) superfamily phosphohydrolase (DUF442 family)